MRRFNLSRIPGLSRAAFVSIITSGFLLVGTPRFATAADDTAQTQESRAKKTTKSARHPTKHAETKSEEAKGEPSRVDVPAADNTATNKRDREDHGGSAEKTADQQKNDKSDIELSAEIRRAVVADKTLSTNAHNVKIIVENGHVTLKGPVASSAEKATLEKKAVEVVGRGGRVTNEVQIAP
ncbi:MAG TPA: BON domain-containing protein [Polyangia bacterium]|nr:BON domain-containing protein [Polyangia bacterium]